MDQQYEENAFLCGSQKIRRYGSLSDSKFSRPRHKRLIVHKVISTDTLQSLELCYKSSMYEIKRLNKLWSDQSLYCKREVLIPIFDDDNLATQPSNERTDCIESTKNVSKANGASEGLTEETVDQLFRRIDLGVKQTKKTEFTRSLSQIMLLRKGTGSRLNFKQKEMRARKFYVYEKRQT